MGLWEVQSERWLVEAEAGGDEVYLIDAGNVSDPKNATKPPMLLS